MEALPATYNSSMSVSDGGFNRSMQHTNPRL